MYHFFLYHTFIPRIMVEEERVTFVSLKQLAIKTPHQNYNNNTCSFSKQAGNHSHYFFHFTIMHNIT